MDSISSTSEPLRGPGDPMPDRKVDPTFRISTPLMINPFRHKGAVLSLSWR